MNRKRRGNRNGHSSLVTIVLIRQPMAQHALAAVRRSWEDVGKLLLLIAGWHTGLRASWWKPLTDVVVFLAAGIGGIWWSSCAISLGVVENF